MPRGANATTVQAAPLPSTASAPSEAAAEEDPSKRKVRTTPFYYGPDSDPTLWESVGQAVSQWDVATGRALAARDRKSVV